MHVGITPTITHTTHTQMVENMLYGARMYMWTMYTHATLNCAANRSKWYTYHLQNGHMGTDVFHHPPRNNLYLTSKVKVVLCCDPGNYEHIMLDSVI